MNKTLTWLHLSDFHFEKEKNWEQGLVLRTLIRDVIKKALPENNLNPDLVFITGDIANQGKAEEYKQAKDFFNKLLDELGHESFDNWFLVPGNHDVDRQSIKRMAKQIRMTLTEESTGEILGESETWEMFSARQANYLQFHQGLLGSERAWTNTAPWKTEKININGLPIAVLCLNSAWACQDKDDHHNILLGAYQVDQALQEAGDAALKIGLFHHPFEDLKPFDKNECKALLTGADGCQFLLRGHLHDPEFILTQNPTRGTMELAAGACWQDAKHPHAVQVVQLDLESQKGKIYAWSYAPEKKFWHEANHLYQGMVNGVWKFPIPSSWNLTSLPVKDTEDKPKVTLIPQRYRRYLETELGHLEPLLDSEKPLLARLKEIYVPLETDWEDPKQKKERMARLDKEDLEDQKTIRRPLAELLGLPTPGHFLVEGGPGAGKSTFTRYTALSQLQGWSQDPKNPSPEVLPILLNLKNFGEWLVKETGISPGLLPAWAGEALKEWGLDEQALRRRLGEGRVLWLLDGLDEIFDECTRLRAAQVIGGWFRGDGQNDGMIITARPHALDQDGVVRGLGLQQSRAIILALDDAGQQVYLKKWFEALYDQAPEKASSMRNLLWSGLSSHRQLAEMRGNPLLLSTIATIFHLGKRLPERRADLYEKAVDVLLQRRFGPTAGGGEEKVNRMRLGLMEVGRGMMEQGAVRELGHKAFMRFLEAGFYSHKEADPKEKLELESLARILGGHSGLLTMSGSPPVYGFPHLGFQEYLAARSIAGMKENRAFLKPYLGKGFWREVILLTAGCLFEGGSYWLGEEFLEFLLGDGKNINSLSLAMWGAVEAPYGAVSQKLTDSLVSHALAQLENEQTKVKDRHQIGQALGKLGDPRLESEKKWIAFEPGEFTMGHEELGDDDNRPTHRVSLTKPFLLGKYPVTNQEYGHFVECGGYKEEKWWCKEGLAWKKKEEMTQPAYWKDPRFNGSNQPVVGVSWYEASAYCRWLTNRYEEHPPEWFQGRSFKAQLPTEAQWEYAASGEGGRGYPWGEALPNSEMANYDQKLGSTSAVGIYPKGRTPEGLYDMAGNVREWCRDVWKNDLYQGRKKDVVDPLNQKGDSAVRALRGGSWDFGSRDLPSAYRDRYRAGYRFDWVGFRVCLLAVPVEHVLGC